MSDCGQTTEEVEQTPVQLLDARIGEVLRHRPELLQRYKAMTLNPTPAELDSDLKIAIAFQAQEERKTLLAAHAEGKDVYAWRE